MLLAMKIFAVLFALFLVSSDASALTASSKMGKGLYSQKGANSCLYCHGVSGEGGSVKAAAKLSRPKTWKIYKILGGDAAFKKDKDSFLKQMKEATVNVILQGAIRHNATFKKPWFDLKKAGKPYDAQMLGVMGAPSMAWLRKYKSKGVTKEIAAESAYLYVQSFDKDSLFGASKVENKKSEKNKTENKNAPADKPAEAKASPAKKG